MPRKKANLTVAGIRRYGTKSNYTTEHLQEAIDKIKSGQMGQREAAKQYNIPRSTLKNKLAGRYNKAVGHPTTLTLEEEEIVANHIIAVSQQGIPVSLQDVRIILKSYLDSTGRKIKMFKDNKPGWEWGKLFLERHPNIKQTFAANISRKRAQVGMEQINSFFDYIEQELVNVPAENIFNFDESGFHDQPKKTKVLFRRSCRHPEVVRNSTKSCFTVMFCGSAAGELLPPYIIFKGTHKWTDWMFKALPGSRMNVSKSGWIDTPIFDDWFQNQLLPVLRKKTGKKIVIGDNLSSHLSIKTLKLCEENNVKFICLIPNSTHLLQPLDVAFFSPLKTAWRSVLLEWRMSSQGIKCISLPNNRFAQLLSETLTQLKERISGNLIAGFRATGLFPLSREHVLLKLPDYTRPNNLDNIQDALGKEFQTFLQSIRSSDLSAPQRMRKYQLPVLPGKSVSAEEVEAFYATKQEAAKQKETKKRQKKVPRTTSTKISQPKKRKVSNKSKYVLSSDSESEVDMESNKSFVDREESITTETRTKGSNFNKNNDSHMEIENENVELENNNTRENHDINFEELRDVRNMELDDEERTINEDKVIEIKEKEIEGEEEGPISSLMDGMPITIEQFNETEPLSTVVKEYVVVGADLQILEPPVNKESKFKIDDYVVVQYDHQYFPGIVTKIIKNKTDGFTYSVNAMQKIGIKWQWPKAADEILYTEEDVIKKINSSDIKPHTNRGIFNVKDSFLLEKWNGGCQESVMNKEKYRVNDYVVVHYEEKFFPGKVTESKNKDIDNFIYKVNAFERFGQKWRWPLRKDEIFYEEKDVIKVIKETDVIPHNNRGMFKIIDSFLLEKWELF